MARHPDGTDPRFRKARNLYKHFPREPRCKMRAVPFAGPMATIMRMRGRGRWSKNPKYCGMCFSVMSQARGGAEMPCTLSTVALYGELDRRGHENVRRYSGGLLDWESAGLPLEGNKA